MATLAMMLGGLMIATTSPAQVNVCPGMVGGGPGDVIDVPILIDNPFGLQVFALDFVFNRGVASYEGIIPSQLLGDWLALDGSENTPGTVTIGGFDSRAIETSDPDTLCYVTLSVLIVGDLSYTTTNFVDDLEGAPDCTESMTAVDASSWGLVKAMYDRE